MTGHGICLYWNVRDQRIPWKVLEHWLWRCLVEPIFGQIGFLRVVMSIGSIILLSILNHLILTQFVLILCQDIIGFITYRILTVFEDPEPFCHPVMTTTLSPDPMKLLLLPKSMAYWTLSSTSFIQSASRSFSYSSGMQPLKICICRATCPYLCNVVIGDILKRANILDIPCDRENGTVRLVLWHNVRGGSRGGEDNYGRSLALVGGQHCADGSRGCVVKACRLLLAFLH